MASEIVVTVTEQDMERYAIDKSIEHHMRMNAWVRSKSEEELHRSQVCQVSPDDPASRRLARFAMQDEMLDAIGEIWKSNDCALCRVFDKWGMLPAKIVCSKCPLGKKIGWCAGEADLRGENCWLEMHMSETWAEWLIYSDKLIEQLRSL